MDAWSVKRGEQEARVPDLEALRGYARSGRLRQDDLVRSADNDEWIKAANVAELASSFPHSSSAHSSRGVRWKLIAGTLTAIALSALVGFWMWTRTPQYAIRQIESAIKTHDIERFKKYVDLDGIAADLLALVRINGPDTGALGSALATSMAGPLQESVKRTLTNMVESQRAGPPQIVYDFIDVDSSFSGIEYLKRDGKVAMVGLRFTTPKRERKPLIYEVRMRDLGSHWQIAGLSLDQIVVAKSFHDLQERNRVEAERAEAERAARQKRDELAAKAAASLSLSLSQSSVIGGNYGGVSATLALSEPAPEDISVRVFADSTAAGTPSSVTIPKGESRANFVVNASAVPTPVRATISVVDPFGTQQNASLLIEPRSDADDLTDGTDKGTRTNPAVPTETPRRLKPAPRPAASSDDRETAQLTQTREGLAEAAATEARPLELARNDATAKGLVFVEERITTGRVYHEPTCPSVAITMKTLSLKAARESSFLPAWDCHKRR